MGALPTTYRFYYHRLKANGKVLKCLNIERKGKHTFRSVIFFKDDRALTFTGILTNSFKL